jgi:hypothetical protein
VQGLALAPAAVLPAFCAAACYQQPVITGEILLALGKLVRAPGDHLAAAAWDLVLDALEELQCTQPPTSSAHWPLPSKRGANGDSRRLRSTHMPVLITRAFIFNASLLSWSAPLAPLTTAAAATAGAAGPAASGESDKDKAELARLYEEVLVAVRERFGTGSFEGDPDRCASHTAYLCL